MPRVFAHLLLMCIGALCSWGLMGFGAEGLTEPSDQELITIFSDHRDAFQKLQQMASEDVQNGWYFNWPNFRGSAPDKSRRKHYMTVASEIPQCFSVATDYDDHIRFCLRRARIRSGQLTLDG
jgi:hypothetical protein